MLLVVALVLAACQKPRKQQTPEADRPVEPPPAAPVARSGAEPQPAPAALASDKDRPASDKDRPASQPIPRPPAPDAGPVELVVITTPALAEAARELGRRFAAGGNGKVKVVEGDLHAALQHMGSGPADVLITEGYTPLEAMRAGDLVAADTIKTVTYLPLTVTVAGRHAESVRSLLDAVRAKLRLGLPDPRRSTAGGAARRLLLRAAVGEGLEERVLPAGPESALKDGTIDLWIGWGRVDVGVPITLPASLREQLPIPAAATSVSKHPEAAKSLVNFMASPSAAELWIKAGTTPTVDEGLPITPTVMPLKLPGPRRNAGVAVVGERMLLVGGETAGRLLDDLTWLDPTRSRATAARTRLPGGRDGVAVVNSLEQGQVLLIGGRTSNGPTHEVLRFSVSDE
ncbi:MAG: ABC-type molybdate transport system substrate-binding protein, partial [Myxococcota bacterium]